MESLLRWGIEHSANADGSQGPPVAPRKDLDPGIIDAILGKSDAQLMKEALAVAVDDARDEDDRVQALDDIEMLVEQIDNANNVEKLKMWEPLHSLLTSPSSTDDVKIQTLWVIGTTVQNNPTAQFSYLSLSPMPTLLSFLSPSVKSAKIRSKAVYALSGLLKHNATAVGQFQDSDGWLVFKAALDGEPTYTYSDITVRRKTAFLLNTLLVPTTPAPLPTPSTPSSALNTGTTLHASAAPSPPPAAPVHPNSHASMLSDPASFSTSPATLNALQEHGLLDALVSSLASPTPYGPDGESEGDPDFEEKIVRSLHTYVTACHGQFSGAQKRELSAFLQEQSAKAGSESKLAERWALTADEVQALRQAVE
ncbi:nucleotide exchange factors-like protein [Amylocystis lapponica]|nr:nucleotide exchange factors-like protein [Amylocystis lapponica]